MHWRRFRPRKRRSSSVPSPPGTILPSVNPTNFLTPYSPLGSRRSRPMRSGNGLASMGIGLRTLVNPNDTEDVKRIHALQDAVKVEQPGGPGKFEVPNWDPVSQKKVRDSLLVLYNVLPDQNRMFGTKTEVDPVRHLIGAAGGWGGNPEKDAVYLNITPKQNDGKAVYRLTAKDVPVDGFWSISIYDAKGYYEKNPYNAYSLNNLTAKKNADGSATVQFGGCDGKVPNCLPIMNGWNYMVRLYQPRPETAHGNSPRRSRRTDVRFWPLTDISLCTAHVRFWG